VAIHLSGPPGGGVPNGTPDGPSCPDSTLLRVGFTEPTGSPRSLVRSYRTVSPLPVRGPEATPSAVCSLWHFPAGRPDWPLTSTLPCGVPTFLGSYPTGGVTPARPFRGHPAGSPSCPWSHTRGARRPAGPDQAEPAGPVTGWLYPGAVSLESRAARLVAEHGGPDALSISEFYNQVDRALRTAFPGGIWITGEIRSMKVLPGDIASSTWSIPQTPRTVERPRST